MRAMQLSRLEFLKGAASVVGTVAFAGRRIFAAPEGWVPPKNPNITFGVVSDTHLRTDRTGKRIDMGSWPDKYLLSAFRHFRALNVDAVVHCGDMADRGQIVELQAHANVWRKVFPDNRAADGRKVEKLFVMGNHDVDGYDYGRGFRVDQIYHFRNGFGFFGHWHMSAANWWCMRLFNGATPSVQCPAMYPFFDDGRWLGGGDKGISVAPLEDKLQGGSWRQGFVVRVYDDMLVISRHEYSAGGSLGSDWIMPLERQTPHPFSLTALKRKIGSPQFRPNAKLQIQVEESTRPTNCKIVKLLIPPADGNAQTRVYAFDVVVVGDGAKEKLLKSVYAAGANMGIGHEPNGGVTTLRIPASELPKGGKLTFAVRPITSLGTRGKALTSQRNMDFLF